MLKNFCLHNASNHCNKFNEDDIKIISSAYILALM